MALTANLDELSKFGPRFRGIPSNELPPELLPAGPSGGDGPLSGGLVGMQNSRATDAAGFAGTMDRGIVAAGHGVDQIWRAMADVDRRGADAIAQLFPEPAPAAGGGQ